MLGRNSVCTIVSAILSCGGFCFTSTASSDASLNVDLSFRFSCRSELEERIDAKIETFLTSHGFKVLNKSRLAKTKNQFSPFVTDIVGIDNSDAIVQISKNKIIIESYSVGLVTRPPTVRRNELEQQLIQFIDTDLGCELSQVERHLNDDQTQDMFNDVLKIKRGWFELGPNKKI